MFKTTGLDEFTKKLEDAAAAIKSLDGDIAKVSFNPNDPSSVEAAVVEMEQTIDTKVAPYRGNKIVESLISKTKEKFRQAIYDRAAKARTESGKET